MAPRTKKTAGTAPATTEPGQVKVIPLVALRES